MKKKKLVKLGFPSKQEVIGTLLKEDPAPKKFEKLMVIVEHKKISKVLGIVKAEVLQNQKIILKGSMTCIPETFEDSFNWNILKDGQSYFEGYSIDYKGETVGSIIKQGLKKSIKEGKIPFLHK